MTFSKTHIALIALVVIVLVASATVLELQTKTASQRQDDIYTLSYQGNASEGLYITDFSDDRKLIGAANNVFVGKVLEQITQTYGTSSDARYLVRVLLNIKGNLENSIVVRIYKGGEGLKVGSTYVISSLYSPASNWYVIGAPFDRKEIARDSNLADSQLRTLAERDDRVHALQFAYINEIPYAGHVSSGTNYNAYTSRCLDAKGELIDDTVQIANEKKGLPKAQCVTRLTPEASPTEVPAATPTPAQVNKPEPPLPSVEPVPTPKAPPAIPAM